MKIEQMVERFQCLGCVCGSDTKCGKYEYSAYERRCKNHVLGASFGIGNNFALGLPKGFNKPGYDYKAQRAFNQIFVSLWGSDSDFDLKEFDHLNIPVWALEEDGFLFVRVYSPRINHGRVFVVEGATIGSICPNAINVRNFIDEID